MSNVNVNGEISAAASAKNENYYSTENVIRRGWWSEEDLRKEGYVNNLLPNIGVMSNFRLFIMSPKSADNER